MNSMNNEQALWSKADLKVYILLLCARIDNEESQEEIELIKSKVDSKTFDRLYTEFCDDCEDDCFEKIKYVIGRHEFSVKELNGMKKDVLEVFYSDKNFKAKERYLDQVLDNILY